MTTDSLETRVAAAIDDIFTHGVDIHHDMVMECGEITLYIWDRRCREYTIVTEYLDELVEYYVSAVGWLVSQECTDVYNDIVGGCHVVDVADHKAEDMWYMIVASEIRDRLEGDDLLTAENDARDLGYWQVSAELKTMRLRDERR